MYNVHNRSEHNKQERSEPMKVTLFFGSLLANQLLAVVTVRYRADLIMPMLTA